MVQFPLALAVEPRLLPFAVANGFQMDAKVRGPVSVIGQTFMSFEVSRFCLPENVRAAGCSPREPH